MRNQPNGGSSKRIFAWITKPNILMSFAGILTPTVGVIAILIYAGPHGAFGVGILTALSSGAVGLLLGLLFGVPRQVSSGAVRQSLSPAGGSSGTQGKRQPTIDRGSSPLASQSVGDQFEPRGGKRLVDQASLRSWSRITHEDWPALGSPYRHSGFGSDSWYRHNQFCEACGGRHSVWLWRNRPIDWLFRHDSLVPE
jgi:hypothetical protein